MTSNKEILADVKKTEMDWLKKIINVNNSGYVERNQNSLMSSLCSPNIGIETEPYSFILKSCTWVMFTEML